MDSFDPVCFLASSPAVLVVNRDSPFRTLKDLLTDARGRPGQLSLASIGPRSTFWMGFSQLTREAKVDMVFVPFPGSAPALTALLGKHVTSTFAGYAVVSEQLKDGGQLRAVAVATKARIEPLPDVPTFIELGFADLEVDNWFGVLAPANTPLENHPSDEMYRRAMDAFECLYAESVARPKIMSIAVHPYLSGQTHRIRHVERAFEDILARSGVACWSGEKILDWYLDAQNGSSQMQ